MPGLTCPRALGSPLTVEAGEQPDQRRKEEEGLERGGARGSGPLRKPLQYPGRGSGSWVRGRLGWV